MKNCALLSPEMLSTIYSKSEYDDHLENKKMSSRVDLYSLHYMIALNFPPSACIKYAEKNKACLVSQDSKFHCMTPLMLAILLEKKEIVEGLAELMTEEDFLVIDEFGFNALHIASLALPSVINLLKKKSDPLQLTFWGGNYQHLTVLAGHTPPEKFKYRFQVMDKSGNLRDGSLLSSEELRSLTGLEELRDSALYDSPEGRCFLWQKQHPLSSHEQMIFQTFFDYKVRAYNLSPPKFIVKPSPQLFLSENPLGLFIDEEIPPFTKLATYGGRFTESSDSFYVFGKVDGKHIGGLAPLANCGFPNSIYIILHYNGDEQKDLFSMQSLSRGEEILVSYGSEHFPFKFGRQVLLGVDEAEAFFKHFQTHLKEYININQKLADPNIFNKTLLEQTQIAICVQATFPLHYPNYLLHLWAKGITPAQFWIDAMDMDKENFPHMKTSTNDYQFLKIQCQILLELEALEKKDPWGYIPNLKKWILERIGILKYLELYCATFITKEEFQNNHLNGDNFSSFFESLPNVAKELVLENFKDFLLLKYL